ncbi:MAG: TlyA family rRNA (cytidine-2'-O)-methyltransferase [Nitrospinaceae bacterium]|nr:MAG: TlyA family rRNA (cytidine-2'-O)-methyltransferase [Nitrospinaceae bacterium]
MSSRERAQGLILAGKVRLGDEVADKPGRMVLEGHPVSILEDLHPYVSRGGVKLEGALKEFQINPKEKTAADIGASTGGFTDCLLKNAAKKVFAVDVGYGQLDWKLRKDPRVVCLERKNVRYLAPNEFGESVDLAVIDVSFISLKLIIPPVLKVLKPDGDLLALVKPQFEVGKDEVENKGIIKDPVKHLTVLHTLKTFIQDQGWVMRSLTVSPILGQKGNREFFIHCVTRERGETVGEDEIQKRVLS